LQEVLASIAIPAALTRAALVLFKNLRRSVLSVMGLIAVNGETHLYFYLIILSKQPQ
jgi:hypothetical protein